MSDTNATEIMPPAPELVVTMDQTPGENSAAPALSPLASLCGYPNVVGAEQTVVYDGLQLSEQRLLSYLVVRGNADDLVFAKGIANALGVSLPGPLQALQQGEVCILWIGPDEWLVTAPEKAAYSLEIKLRENLGGHFAVVNTSGGLTTVLISGSNARRVLMKSTPYDVHDKSFPIGKVVTTVFGKAQATIHRVAEEEWQLIIRRSFSQYLWAWLINASVEFQPE